MPGPSIEWDPSEFFAGLDGLVGDFRDATPVALGRGGEVLRGAAVQRAPIREGHLRESAEMKVEGAGFEAFAKVTFPGPYARRQHYELEWKHPRGGEALYLLHATQIELPSIIATIAAAYREVL